MHGFAVQLSIRNLSKYLHTWHHRLQSCVTHPHSALSASCTDPGWGSQNRGGVDPTE